MNGTTHATRAFAVAAAMCLSAAASAGAQWSVTGLAVGEIDTQQTGLLLGGLSASPGGLGVAPIIGAQAYFLTYDAGTRTSVFSVRPYAGLRSGFNGGELTGTVGYAFTNKETSAAPVVLADRGQGVVASAGLDVWGTEPMAYQALASYNFGSDDVWARGRVTRRIGASAGPSQTRFGAEVAYLNGTGYSAVQPGLVLEMHGPSGGIWSLGAGAKLVNGGDDAAYFKVETVFPLKR